MLPPGFEPGSPPFSNEISLEIIGSGSSEPEVYYLIE